MRALETSYNGYRFRSRLEARWAVFFDACQIRYVYEPEGYDLSQAVCPSPHVPCFCEALWERARKGDFGDEGADALFERINADGHTCGPLSHCVCKEISGVSGKALWYLPDFFLPTIGLRTMDDPGLFFEIKGTSSAIDDARCTLLGVVSKRPVILAEVLPFYPANNTDEGLYQMAPWWDNFMCFMRCGTCHAIKIEFQESNYMFCSHCGGEVRHDDPLFTFAALQARSARFEHGEKGATS